MSTSLSTKGNIRRAETLAVVGLSHCTAIGHMIRASLNAMTRLNNSKLNFCRHHWIAGSTHALALCSRVATFCVQSSAAFAAETSQTLGK